MEYLVVAVILYFILQTTGNLVYILRGGAKAPSTSAAPGHNWKGPSPRKHTEGITDRPTYWGKDVEDAKWHDVETGHS